MGRYLFNKVGTFLQGRDLVELTQQVKAYLLIKQ
jgi:hypothetical protein